MLTKTPTREIIWTNEVKEQLVEYVNKRELRKTVKEAVTEFAESRGLNPSTASTMYYSMMSAAKRKRQTVKRAKAREYTEQEKRILVLGHHFARREGVRYRDVCRYVSMMTGKPLRAVEQQMYALRKTYNQPIPREIPDDIKEVFLHIKKRRVVNKQPAAAQQVADAMVEAAATSATAVAEEQTQETTKEAIDEAESLAALQIAELDIFDALSVLASATRKIQGIDVDALIRQLAMIANLAVQNTETANMRNELFLLTKENIRLRNEIDAQVKENNYLMEKNKKLEEMIAEYNEWLKEAKEQQDIVNFVVDELTSLRTIEQIGGLKDYLGKIKHETDKFGVVVRSIDQWRERYEEQLASLKDELSERFKGWQDYEVASAKEVS